MRAWRASAGGFADRYSLLGRVLIHAWLGSRDSQATLDSEEFGEACTGGFGACESREQCEEVIRAP